MNSKLLKPLVVLGSAIALTAASTGVANAFTPPTEQEYYNQLGGAFGLSYEDWALFNSYINPEEEGLGEDQLTALNPADLTWEAGVDGVEVYFVNEGAGYINQFGYSTDGGETVTTIWDDVNTPDSFYDRNHAGPLALGEGVQLGSFGSGTVLDFFLTSETGNVFGADASQNPNGETHLNVYQSGEFLLLGFEDQTEDENSDWDYNDVVFVVKGLLDTEEDPNDVPEPASAAALLGFAAFGLVKTRRRQAV
ncbi:MAG: DUF4114 domain-containing protein [Cyanobacteria bacterium J06632_22]